MIVGVINSQTGLKEYTGDSNDGDFCVIEYKSATVQKTFEAPAGAQLICAAEHTIFVNHDTSAAGREAIQQEMITWQEQHG
ncbi:MAG: hypothetical protein ACPGJS_05680 [Flammeovirgaceae bacterium]